MRAARVYIRSSLVLMRSGLLFFFYFKFLLSAEIGIGGLDRKYIIRVLPMIFLLSLVYGEESVCGIYALFLFIVEIHLINLQIQIVFVYHTLLFMIHI